MLALTADLLKTEASPERIVAVMSPVVFTVFSAITMPLMKVWHFFSESSSTARAYRPILSVEKECLTVPGTRQGVEDAHGDSLRIPFLIFQVTDWNRGALAFLPRSLRRAIRRGQINDSAGAIMAPTN
jgi:hypothetical protein